MSLRLLIYVGVIAVALALLIWLIIRTHGRSKPDPNWKPEV